MDQGAAKVSEIKPSLKFRVLFSNDMKVNVHGCAGCGVCLGMNFGICKLSMIIKNIFREIFF